jgi:hypothetical protein
MTTSSPPPTSSATPRSLRGATVCANPRPRPLWPIPWPTSSAPLWERAFSGAPRDPRSSPGSSVPSPRPCPPHGSPPPTKDAADGKLLVRPPQQRLDPFVIHHLRAHDLRLEDEAFGVNQDVALTALDLLAAIVTSLFPAHRGALHRLAVHHARAELKGSRFKRTRRRSRRTRLTRSQVPSRRHFLK